VVEFYSTAESRNEKQFVICYVIKRVDCFPEIELATATDINIGIWNQTGYLAKSPRKVFYKSIDFKKVHK
jgi:hypothetical protein